MRRRITTDPNTPAARLRLHFEGRSVQLIAAWTLAMGGLAVSQSLTPTRGAGGTSATLSQAAASSALPPLTARLPRR